jgi:hypothetical protein
MKIISPSDEPTLDNGYYLYNGNIHTDRHSIAEEMLNQQKTVNSFHTKSNVKFVFHDELFSKFDWAKEPTESLQELYKQRAIQLRDKYKYLIVGYSGGSDSHQILQTFLDNDIFVDEVFTSTWQKLLSGIDRAELSADEHLKFFLEYELNVVPMLKLIKEKSPLTKITVADTSDFLYNDVKTRNFEVMGMLKTNGGSFRGLLVPIPQTIKLFAGYTVNKLSQDGIAFISGVDKPVIQKHGKSIFACFSDVGYTYDKLMNNKVIDKVCKFEYFYWTPDFPLIPIKQAHVVKKALETDKTFFAVYLDITNNAIKHDQNRKFGHNHWHDFDQYLIHKIYPDLKGLSYVVGKPKKISPELKLLSKYHGMESIIEGAYVEAYSYRMKKFGNFENDMLKGTIKTKNYYIGEFEPKWNSIQISDQ